jgi:translation initiation factor IF-3
VRLIDDEGNQVGVIDRNEALNAAREKGLDLVEVAPNADPPVCRLMDFGKFMYTKSKRERQAKKAQAKVEVKEVQLRPKTGEHDINFKVRDARGWLEKGAKVRVRVRFRGREVTHPEVARDLMDRIQDMLKDVSVVEQAPRLEGRSMLMILASDTSKK